MLQRKGMRLTPVAQETPSGPNGHHPDAPSQPSQVNGSESPSPALFTVTVLLPHSPSQMEVMVSSQEQIQDLRQSLMESPAGLQYTCFHLEFQCQRLNDFVEVSHIPGLTQASVLTLVQDPYTEREARSHLLRIRDLIGAPTDRVDAVHGLFAGLTLHEHISQTSISHYDLDSPPAPLSLLPPSPSSSIKPLSFLGLSPWNPPPPHLRQQGHLLYLQLLTLEGERFELVSHVTGFYRCRSTTSQFDPTPQSATRHSLIGLISEISAAFDKAFAELLQAAQKRDPLINFQLTQAAPANPWIVRRPLAHESDVSRCQEAYLMSGMEGNETMRDWNEEIQSTREMPRSTVQERVFRERLMLKVYAEFTDAATRGAVMVAREELLSLNPTEPRDAQIYVFNNIFYSFGADGVGVFADEGGYEAARVAVGKDVAGVQAVNQLDIAGLSTAGTIIVDYLGRRIVAQSIVPGIFKQREPEENQVDYGGIDGRDHIASNEAFVPTFSQVGKALKIKRHPVWDKQGHRHDLESSIETKGMLGTDGRKYILDLYRLTPLDIDWIERYGQAEEPYLHRMTSLRPELLDAYWRMKLGEHVNKLVPSSTVNQEQGTIEDQEQRNIEDQDRESINDEDEKTIEDEEQKTVDTEGTPEEPHTAFSLSFNPDVFCGQVPQNAEEQREWASDERLVRDVCRYLHEDVFSEFLKEIADGEAGFPVDGIALGRLMHRRGINLRYLGHLAHLCDSSIRGQALKALIQQEMVARAFKHVSSSILRHLPVIFAPPCLAHLLNGLLGLESKPSMDCELQRMYPEADFSFSQLTSEALWAKIAKQVWLRYRYRAEPLSPSFSLIRSIALKLGLQLLATSPIFEVDIDQRTKKDKVGKKGRKNKGFRAQDIAMVVPVVKHSEPKSNLAEEALEAGKMSMMQGQKELGQELLLESLTLHEQIYGVLHPQVARVYHQLATLYFQIDDKTAAVDLAHKAVVIFERTEGLDASETILSYLNLALFEHAKKNSETALRYVYHALEMWKVIYGMEHPDVITTLNNAAVMLQHLHMYGDSRRWFERSLKLSEVVSGTQSAGTGTLLFQLAQALVLDGDHKGAVGRIREAYSIFLALFGAEHANTKESEKWLEQLTSNAVSVAKHAKDLQQRRGTRQIVYAPATRPGLSASPPSPVAPASEGPDSRNIDELIKFIEGGGSKAGGKKKGRPRSGTMERSVRTG